MSNKKTSVATAKGVANENEVPPIEQQTECANYTPKQFDPNQIVTVRNGFQGELVYRSPKTGERFVWDSFGSEQDMELSELRTARSAHKKYFENNWFLFDDPEVIEYLGLRQYYKNALSVDDFDDIFRLPAGKLKERLSLLSKGQRRSVAYRAKQLIADGQIDSIKVISTLEECLGIELIER